MPEDFLRAFFLVDFRDSADPKKKYYFTTSLYVNTSFSAMNCMK